MLDDIRVLEVGVAAGTGQCGKMLADLGASVVRAEPPGGDPLRTIDPQFAAYLHAGKQSIIVDPGSDGLATIAAAVDIAVCDRRDTEVVAELAAAKHGNPRLSVVYLSDYGLPEPGFRANAFTLEAEAGLMSLRNTFGLPPVCTGVELCEMTAGICAALAAVTLVLDRDAGGAGVDVEVSRLEALVALVGYPWLPDQIKGHLPDPIPAAVIGTVQPATDGWVCVVVATQPHWEAFTAMAGIPELTAPRFATLGQRLAQSDQVSALIQRFTEQHTVAELLELSDLHRVPITPVTDPADVPASVAHAGRGTFVTSEIGDATLPRPPFRFLDAPDWRPKPLAAPGVHDPAVLAPAATLNVDPRLPAVRRLAPLAGLRVVQFGLFQAGPLASSYLTWLGADVIKVEGLRRPDLIRFAQVPTHLERPWDRNSLFNMVNLGARGITAELSDPRGVEILRRLLATAHVVIENYSPRVLDKVGLGPDSVRRDNPDVVFVRMPAWGLEGRWRDRPGFTFTAEATAGMTFMTGYPGDRPLLSGSVINPVSSFTAALATLAAVRRRLRTGEGSVLEVPLCDAATQLSARSLIAASHGTPQRRVGNRSAVAAPQGTYRAADGSWVAISVDSDAQWAGLAGLPGIDETARAPALATTTGRQAALEQLNAVLTRFCGSTSAPELVAVLRGAGVPVGLVAHGEEVIEHPMLAARRRVVTIEHPIIGAVDYIGWPMTFSTEEAMWMPGPAPMLGQHNHEVLADLGFSTGEIAQLRADGVIGDSPHPA